MALMQDTGCEVVRLYGICKHCGLKTIYRRFEHGERVLHESPTCKEFIESMDVERDGTVALHVKTGLITEPTRGAPN
jgi:hypothetical protein